MLDRILQCVDDARDEIVELTQDLIRVPTINPPGEHYRDCAELLGKRLESFDYEVSYVTAEGRPEHSKKFPRVNVVGSRGSGPRPLVHLNGHIDVVPVGEGWTEDPFGGTVRDGRIYGRGSADMKAGIAAAVYAAEAVRRAGAKLAGTIEISGSVDEESGGQAGVRYLAERGAISHERTDYVIIPEPLNVDRICVGHRGVYWFKVTALGKIAHGSMPFLGVSAIDAMTALLARVRSDILPQLQKRRSEMPVVPDGARHATLNVNGVIGGQTEAGLSSPCVADRCVAVFDRRFLIEEPLADVRAEFSDLIAKLTAEHPEYRFEVDELMTVEPVQTPPGSRLVSTVDGAIQHVLGKPPALIASPGTYDHKHVDRVAGVKQCIAYGPGILELAHQVDEYCEIDDLLNATKVLALSLVELLGGH